MNKVIVEVYRNGIFMGDVGCLGNVEIHAFYTKKYDNLHIEKIYLYENGVEFKVGERFSACSIAKMKCKLIDLYWNLDLRIKI